MGGTFTGATIVPTGNAKNPIKLESDSIVPNLGSLPATGGAMTSDTGLPPTDGVDVKLIHGNRWQTIEQKMHEEIGGDLFTRIGGSETHDVLSNQTNTITGNVNETILGASNYTYVDVQNNTHNATVTTDYASLHHTSQPTSFLDYISNQSTAGLYLGQYITFNVQCYGTNLQFALGQAQVCVPMNFGLAGYTFNAGGLDITPKGFAQSLTGFVGKLHGVKTEDGGPEIKALVISINTIMIGINQCF